MAYLSPDKSGKRSYEATILLCKYIATDDQEIYRTPIIFDQTGSFVIKPTDKTGRDFRNKGRLEYIGKRYHI